VSRHFNSIIGATRELFVGWCKPASINVHNKAVKYLCLATLLWPVSAYSVTFVHGVDETAKLPFWSITNQGVSIRLVQRLPDQSRAFFMARGFSPEHAEVIAQSCVFQTVFKNISHKTENPSPVSYNLRNWVVMHDGKNKLMKVREDWDKEWKARNAPMPAQIAFKWGLFPTEQVYQPGDYNWGMSMFNLKPGSKFDLKVVWVQHGKSSSAIIKNIECAPDVEAPGVK
jgi:hypothetical protein